MDVPSVFSLPSYRRQNLLVEFASLKYVQLQGIYVTLSQGDPSQWSGVLFVRQGPYAPAVLRFRIAFPSAYPLSPPSVVFNADVFHPLLTPLTTITYTTGISEREAAHAAGHERLPPGSFGLRHGFPQWFKPAHQGDENHDANGQSQPLGQQSPTDIHVVDVLRYVRSCFEDETVLDAVPFEAAGNSGAWYAWRAHRESVARKASSGGTKSPSSAAATGSPAKKEGAKSPAHSRSSSIPQNRPRRPSEWNWEGVWEERVKKAVKSSLSEPALFGSNSNHPDEIHFQSVQEDDLSEIHSDMRQHLDAHD